MRTSSRVGNWPERDELDPQSYPGIACFWIQQLRRRAERYVKKRRRVQRLKCARNDVLAWPCAAGYRERDASCERPCPSSGPGFEKAVVQGNELFRE
ncbi:hypothetical protein BaRGS_00007215 [Batillaria attramentaria]|uniref:Uncharacterized protein n=1 Tax=Batillaria attramentaria TaxID=370345 RepID=A0ABD0LQA6_9CAEN